MSLFGQEIMAGLLLLTGIVMLCILNRHRNLQRQCDQQRGLALLVKMRDLLSNIQKHRGLTHGFHGGDRSLSADIQQLQNRIGADIADIATIGGWVGSNERWNNLCGHWRRLCASFNTLEQENCLLQHNMLISNVLYLIEDTADAHQLHRLNADISAACLVWKELLVTAEYIGQARALGTGVTASGHCTSVSRIRLNYLRQKIEETTRLTWRHLDVASDVKNKLAALLQCIEQQVLVDQPTIASQAYFKLATETLDGVFAQFDREVHALKYKL